MPIKGPGYHLLGDHFHPILAVLAPVYRLFPGPNTLLVAQAALFAISALPVTRLAIQRFGTHGGLAIGAAYGLSWGIQQAVAFDFHEICFAVPLLAFSLECLTRQRWGAAVAWAAPLVLVKEDLPLTVAAIGGYLILRGQRRSHRNLRLRRCRLVADRRRDRASVQPGRRYPYTASGALTTGIPVKLLTVAMILLPTALLAARSPIILIALPTLAWRFWTDNPNYWGTGFHYSAVLMPIAFIALLDAPAGLLERHRRWLPRFCLAFAMLLTLAQPFRHFADPATWSPRSDQAAVAMREVLKQIPDGATVAASNLLAPQLTDRCEVYLFATYPSVTLRPAWVVVTDSPGDAVVTPERYRAAVEALPGLGYRQVHSGDGLLLFAYEPGQVRTGTNT